MVDRFFSTVAVGFALFFMVLELTYVNSKSLMFLVSESGSGDRFFSVVGAVAFSMVTVVVMRKSESKWIKIAFPIFDIALVFCGFNLRYADQILSGIDNPIRFWLTVFMALFTGLITHSLGLINHDDHTRKDDSTANQQGIIDDLSCRLDDSNNELKRIIAESSKFRNESSMIQQRLLYNSIRFEAWSASKKNVSNRTPHESNVCALAEKIKSGESVTINEYQSHLN